MLVRWPSAKGANSRGSGRPWRSGRNDGMESSSEEKSVDGPDVWGACCGSLRGSSDAQVFEPSDRRYVVRSMALMLPSLTQRRGAPGANAPGHSHTEVPAGTWHMDLTFPSADQS